jgi:hypothetical protein
MPSLCEVTGMWHLRRLRQRLQQHGTDHSGRTFKGSPCLLLLPRGWIAPLANTAKTYGAWAWSAVNVLNPSVGFGTIFSWPANVVSGSGQMGGVGR